MDKKLMVSASTNPPEIKKLLAYIEKLDKLDIDFIHCDIMDGSFVEAKTFDCYMIACIASKTSKKLDVHLMVKNPKDVKKYINVGAAIITIHLEAFDSPEDDVKVREQNDQKVIKTLKEIVALGAVAGISVKPNTNLERLTQFLPYVGLVLVMSVEPGKSGQEFMPEATGRIKWIKNKINELKLSNILIEADGGINDKNARDIKTAGADIIVVGNYLFASKNRAGAIKKLKI